MPPLGRGLGRRWRFNVRRHSSLWAFFRHLGFGIRHLPIPVPERPFPAGNVDAREALALSSALLACLCHALNMRNILVTNGDLPRATLALLTTFKEYFQKSDFFGFWGPKTGNFHRRDAGRGGEGEPRMDTNGHEFEQEQREKRRSEESIAAKNAEGLLNLEPDAGA